jgi:hypothetical protein
VIRIRSELVKYFFLRRWSVGVLLECNFLLYTADPHIRIIEEEGLMRFQFGVHVMADLGLFYHMRACTRVDDETWSKHSNARDGQVQAARVSEGQGEETYWIERGRALYSS